MQGYCDVYKWTILKRTSPEVKCLHPTSSRREMWTSSVSNVIYHKFLHGAAFYTLNGKNVNVMLEFWFKMKMSTIYKKADRAHNMSFCRTLLLRFMSVYEHKWIFSLKSTNNAQNSIWWLVGTRFVKVFCCWVMNPISENNVFLKLIVKQIKFSENRETTLKYLQ